MRSSLLAFILACALFPFNALAEDGGKSLFFQADKNNLQILPQRFEYNLDDEDHIRLGDILIDSNTFGFQISSAPDQLGNYRARFLWPAGLLREGVLSIRDNTGKAIWSVRVNRQNTRLVAPAAPQQNNLVRGNLVEYASTSVDPALIEDMKYLPFMNFCINRQAKDTNIYLCSKEAFLENQQNKLAIRMRALGKRTAFVEINGRSVSNQGVIYLNNEKENIGFRAMTQSGAILEIETRMKPVDFKDVVLTNDGKNLILRASGAEPVNEERVKKISATEWQFEVDARRPVLYLKGEGDIPMRQEFYAQGVLPKEEFRPHLKDAAVERVYRSSVTLQGTAAKGTTVSIGDKSQTLNKNGSEFDWTLADLPRGELSRHYLKVQAQQNSFLAAYDIYRGYAFEVMGLGSYWSASSQLYADVRGSWWMENFLGLQQDWTHFHWGLNVSHSLLLNKKDTEANLNITHLELLWRAQSGFHLADPTWGLALPIEIISATGFSTTSPGIGVFYESPSTAKLSSLFQWYNLKLNYLLGGSGDIKLKNALQLEGMAYYQVNSQMSWNYGLGLLQYSFDPGTSKTQIQLSGGASYRF